MPGGASTRLPRPRSANPLPRGSSRREIALVERLPHERASFVPVERLPLLQLRGVLEERDEQSPRVGLRTQRKAALVRELAPCGAHLGPEGFGGGVVAPRRFEIEIADAVVARHAVLASDGALVTKN